MIGKYFIPGSDLYIACLDHNTLADDFTVSIKLLLSKYSSVTGMGGSSQLAKVEQAAYFNNGHAELTDEASAQLAGKNFVGILHDSGYLNKIIESIELQQSYDQNATRDFLVIGLNRVTNMIHRIGKNEKRVNERANKFADRILDRYEKRFKNRSPVFIGSRPVGEDFAKRLGERVDGSDVFVVGKSDESAFGSLKGRTALITDSVWLPGCQDQVMKAKRKLEKYGAFPLYAAEFAPTNNDLVDFYMYPMDI
ncbi:MAG: hypothetical protein JXC85_04855 [Candidatus Aenigmarchaeota archaeon]|nr:hypothetical protein [Candidatus Aenigmarchaeota archaeon]